MPKPLLFSIIIPMYNVEKYIERCLNSVLNQTLDKSNFEVILIDDGSPDNSAKVAEKIIKEYNNCTIISQENKGLGGARNTGIEHAQGKYLLFLDSDDYFYKNALELLSKNINDEDIIEYTYAVVDDNSELSINTFEKTSYENGYSYILNSKSVNSACNKAYKLSFLNQNKLRFKERIYGEDIEFNNRSFFLAASTSSIPDKIIAFYQSPDSITRNKTKEQEEKYLKDLTAIILNYKKFYDFHNTNNKLSKEEIDYLNYRLSSINLNSLLYFLKSKYKREVVFHFIKNLEDKNAFYLGKQLKERELFRKILKIKLFRNIVINIFCKS